MTDQIKAAAHQVAELEAAANAAADELAAAHGRGEEIRGRRAALTAERDAIAAARRAGGDADGARLALLGVDIEGLDSLLAEANAAVAVSQAKADHARAAAETARQHLDRVTDTELLAQLRPHADKLCDLLGATIAEIDAAAKRLQKSRPEYCPPAMLAESLYRLHLLMGPRQ
jgi:hypothetical protein